MMQAGMLAAWGPAGDVYLLAGFQSLGRGLVCSDASSLMLAHVKTLGSMWCVAMANQQKLGVLDGSW
jgi:hypothetical protein